MASHEVGTVTEAVVAAVAMAAFHAEDIMTVGAAILEEDMAATVVVAIREADTAATVEEEE